MNGIFSLVLLHLRPIHAEHDATTRSCIILCVVRNSHAHRHMFNSYIVFVLQPCEHIIKYNILY
jgi:hypothetical protein